MVITSDWQCFSIRIQNFRNENLLWILDRKHKRTDPGFKFDEHITGRAWKVVKVNGPGKAGPDQRQAGLGHIF